MAVQINSFTSFNSYKTLCLYFQLHQAQQTTFSCTGSMSYKGLSLKYCCFNFKALYKLCPFTSPISFRLTSLPTPCDAPLLAYLLFHLSISLSWVPGLLAALLPDYGNLFSLWTQTPMFYLNLFFFFFIKKIIRHSKKVDHQSYI